MFFKKKIPIGAYRIESKYLASIDNYVFSVQKFQESAAMYGCYTFWQTKQMCSSMKDAVDWVKKYKKEDNPTYYYDV